MLKKVLLAATLLLLFPIAALAQSAPATGTSVDFGPVVRELVLPVLGGVLLGLIGYGLRKFGALTGIKLDEKDSALFNDIAQKGLAMATARLAKVPLTLDVHSPIIADATRYVLSHGDEVRKRKGLTPEQIAEKLLARFMDPSVPVGVVVAKGTEPPAAS